MFASLGDKKGNASWQYSVGSWQSVQGQAWGPALLSRAKQYRINTVMAGAKNLSPERSGQ
ncbi:hypothetical protein CHL67_07845 [Prosthecochloris sp. GSB1]|nr:hypothetical protein CHL67_07845 [Prosthecochloris sp. GSB1]